MKGRSTEIVLTPRWFLVFVLLGWLFVLVGVVFLLFAIVEIAVFLSGGAQIPGVVIGALSGVALAAGVGIPTLLFGIWLAGIRTKMTCSNGSQYITVTRGEFPIFLPSLRTKRISREEARTAFVEAETREGTSPSTYQTYWYTEYLIKVRLLLGGTLKIFNAGLKRRRAEDLVRRIREFLGEPIPSAVPERPKDAYALSYRG